MRRSKSLEGDRALLEFPASLAGGWLDQKGLRSMSHVILLGDSIFDNARYVPDAPSVVEHLEDALPAGSRAMLLAVDGSVVVDVRGQLRKVPADATHLVVSVGGNDAMGHSLVLFHEPASSFAEVLTRLGEVVADFSKSYRAMLDRVRELSLPTALCTVYDAIPGLRPEEKTGLALFNEVILREASRAGLPVVDLRLVCDDPGDFSALSPIEPSGAGGLKIARAIAGAISHHDFTQEGCRLYH